MPTGKINTSGQLRPIRKAHGSGGDAIAEVYKALRARSFYPEGHPLRGKIIGRAYDLLRKAMHGQHLSVLITRNGLSAAEKGTPIENTVAAKSLARELFTREISMLTFLPDLSGQEFEDFLAILTVEPQTIVKEGGMEKLLAERGIRHIVTNEIDISAVFTRKGIQESENGELSPEPADAVQAGVEFDFLTPDETEEMEIEELIDTMKKESGDGRYAALAASLQKKARILIGQERFDELMPVVLFLVNQCSDTSRSRPQRECAHAAFEAIAEGDFTRYLLRQLEDRAFKSKEIAYLILNRLGDKAVTPSIEHLNKADNIHSRKALATALVRIGRPAVPSLTAQLVDYRWYVVRSMLTILGEIRCKECVRDLRATLFHGEARVRKEAIRCLTKIGGPDVPDILIQVLTDQDPSVVKLAIFSLGILKSERAVDPLMDIIRARDMFLKTLPLKKEALRAIGLIGAKRTLPQLMKLAGGWHLFAAKRRDELKASAIEAIGRIGDETAVNFLHKMSSRGGPVGKACKQALHSISSNRASADEARRVANPG